jgi:O-6-methylguanine DNA methyltransferase
LGTSIRAYLYTMQAEVDYNRIERAIHYIREHHTAQPSLEDIAEHVHMSPYHFQRLFTKWAGISPFQLKVWEALLKIPFGELVSYQSVSEHVDNPRGLQATGGAIGKNPVAFLIPCHRVVRKTGEINGYRWGLNRKSALIV